MSLPLSAKAECWIWFALAICSVIMRFMSQYIIRKRKFLSDIPVDDILMLVLIFIYTAAITALYLYFDIVAETDFESITPEQGVAIGRELGILNILAETAIQTTLWGNKCCLLLLYNRLTLLGHYRKTWFTVATYTGLAYVAVIVALYGGWCRPFSDYMELEPGNLQCLTWRSYNILQITMNLSTDLILLLIPVTLISKLKMRIGKYVRRGWRSLQQRGLIASNAEC
ncbi:decarboxylase [Colletotrichum tofieldiae]|uniref:Decarboxylase n=1 Tax=Colletotrichum tofieldiae TaxID=708197 RepID=A0A166WXX9_9PEZI|nr:decarboxylase [Colletotrichum tofieldiae]